MMGCLVLDGATDALYAASGISWNTYPLTIAGWTKPPNNTQDKTAAALGLTSDNFMWLDHNAAALRMLNRFSFVDATPSKAAVITANVWQPIIGVKKDADEAWCFHNASISAVNTTNNGAIPSFTRFAIGCGIRNAGPERFWLGRTAHWSLHNTAADQAFADAHAAGTPAGLLANCLHWFPCESDSADIVGSWVLGDVGTPTYEPADGPPIIYPDEGSDDYNALVRFLARGVGGSLSEPLRLHGRR